MINIGPLKKAVWPGKNPKLINTESTSIPVARVALYILRQETIAC